MPVMKMSAIIPCIAECLLDDRYFIYLFIKSFPRDPIEGKKSIFGKLFEDF